MLLFFKTTEIAVGRTGAVVSVADYGPMGSPLRDLAAAQFVVALSKSPLATA